MLVQAVDEREVRADVTMRIKALGRQGRANEAVAELASMAELGVQPDAQAATALLDACVRSKKIDTMESVYEELFGRAAAALLTGAALQGAGVLPVALHASKANLLPSRFHTAALKRCP